MSPYNGYLLHLMKLSFLTGQLFGVINYAALTDHIHLDLSGIFQFSFNPDVPSK